MGKFGDILVTKDQIVIPFHDVFFGTLGVIYLICDLITGFVTCGLGLACSLLVKHIVATDPTDDLSQSFKFFGYIQLVGWVTQFVGHGVYEQRAPALFTNFFFMFIAPFFCVFEYLNMFFGYKQSEFERL